MAARQTQLTNPSPVLLALPDPPANDTEVVAAARLREQAQTERQRAELAVADAEAALEQHRAAAADRLLDDLADGTATEAVGEGDLVARLEAAQRHLGTASTAVALATTRYREILSAATARFEAELRPVIEERLARVTELLATTITENDALRALMVHAHASGATGLPAPWETAFAIRDASWLADELARRSRLFSTEPEPLSAGLVLVKWLRDTMPFAAGETCALPEADAVTHALALNAEIVDEAAARRLGVSKVPRFVKPQIVRFLRDFTVRFGVLAQAGTEQVANADDASRLINLGIAERVGDADAD